MLTCVLCVCVCGCGCCVFLVDRWQHCTKFLPLTEESPVQTLLGATVKMYTCGRLVFFSKSLSRERIVSCYRSKLLVTSTRTQWPTPPAKMLESKGIEHIV